MRKRPALAFCLFLFLFLVAPLTNAQDTFRGIIPFVTTRSEVEKKLGKPNKDNRYELDEGTVYILYRETECDKAKDRCICLVPIGTVLQVEVQPHPAINITELNLDPKLWEQSEITGGHVPGQIYTNHKTGITYEVINDTVSQIIYRASEETCKMLSERRRPAHQGAGNYGASISFPVDSVRLIKQIP